RPPSSTLSPSTTLFRSALVLAQTTHGPKIAGQLQDGVLVATPQLVLGRTGSGRGLVGAGHDDSVETDAQGLRVEVLGPVLAHERSEEHTSELQSRGHLV